MIPLPPVSVDPGQYRENVLTLPSLFFDAGLETLTFARRSAERQRTLPVPFKTTLLRHKHMSQTHDRRCFETLDDCKARSGKSMSSVSPTRHKTVRTSILFTGV